MTNESRIVVVSRDGEHWELPAGRPDGDEIWEETLRREMLEEACAIVVSARLLGFSRSLCIAGWQEGHILVRSFWRAVVDLAPWEPGFEISHRRAVPGGKVLSECRVEEGNDAIFRRALSEAGFT